MGWLLNLLLSLCGSNVLGHKHGSALVVEPNVVRCGADVDIVYILKGFCSLQVDGILLDSLSSIFLCQPFRSAQRGYS